MTKEELQQRNKEYQREYYRKNKERINARAKEWYKNNKERHLEMNKKWMEKNADRSNAVHVISNRKWRAINRHKISQYNRASRSRRLSASGFHTEKEWEALKAMYGYTCPSCLKREPEISLTRDHITPLKLGGSDYIVNIQPLCKPCNCRKHLKDTKYPLINAVKLESST